MLAYVSVPSSVSGSPPSTADIKAALNGLTATVPFQEGEYQAYIIDNIGRILCRDNDASNVIINGNKMTMQMCDDTNAGLLCYNTVMVISLH